MYRFTRWTSTQPILNCTLFLRSERSIWERIFLRFKVWVLLKKDWIWIIVFIGPTLGFDLMLIARMHIRYGCHGLRTQDWSNSLMRPLLSQSLNYTHLRQLQLITIQKQRPLIILILIERRSYPDSIVLKNRMINTKRSLILIKLRLLIPDELHKH